MSADPMKWEEADLMGDVPPPRWRHTATLLPDGVRSASPSLRCRVAPMRPHPLLHLCLPAPLLTSQDNIMMFGGHCKGRHAAALTAPIPAFSPSLPPYPPPPPPPPLRTPIHALTSHAPSALRSGATTMCTCSLSRRTSGPSRSAPARCRSRARTPASSDAGPPPRAQEQPGFRLAPPRLPPPPPDGPPRRRDLYFC